MSPCMADTVKLFCRIFSVSQSTLRLVLQKMTAWQTGRARTQSPSAGAEHHTLFTWAQALGQLPNPQCKPHQPV